MLALEQLFGEDREVVVVRRGRARGAPAGDEVAVEPSGRLDPRTQEEDENHDGGVGLVPKDEYVTIREAAQYLSISEPVLRLTIRCGKIPARRGRGGLPLVNKKHLLPFLYPLLEGRLD